MAKTTRRDAPLVSAKYGGGGAIERSTNFASQFSNVLEALEALTNTRLRPAIALRRYRSAISQLGSNTAHQKENVVMNMELTVIFIGAIFLTPSLSVADVRNGEQIFLNRCAMCHGSDAKGSGPLANKSYPPTPDLTTLKFKKRLHEYPGVIVSSVILRPNGDLIPKTLRENNVQLPAFTWTVKDFRDLNEYLTGKIAKSK